MLTLDLLTSLKLPVGIKAGSHHSYYYKVSYVNMLTA